MKYVFLSLFVCGCASVYSMPDDFTPNFITGGDFTLMTYGRISDATSPVHIYIEGDGNSFDSWGQPTSNPTPRRTFLRDIASRDPSPNVVYLARPCQYIMSPTCESKYWTSGRFSERVIDSVSAVIKDIADNRPVVLVGYSGGAMVSGLVIQRNPDIRVLHWVTIAGVLNHHDWSEYFGDAPLSESLDMDVLPNVPQTHYIAQHDKVVPSELSRRWTNGQDLVVVPGATHNSFPGFQISLK